MDGGEVCHSFTRSLANTDEIVKEFREMISYATQYIALSVLEYHSVWWRLFHAPSSAVLVLAELLFSLPASNGKLEQVFFIVGTIKVNKRSLLTNDSLDDLLLLNSDKVLLEKLDPNPSSRLLLGLGFNFSKRTSQLKKEGLPKRLGKSTNHA